MLRSWSTAVMLLMMMNFVTGCASLPMPSFLKASKNFDENFTTEADDDFQRSYASEESSDDAGDIQLDEDDSEDIKEMAEITGFDDEEPRARKRKARKSKAARVEIVDSGDEYGLDLDENEEDYQGMDFNDELARETMDEKFDPELDGDHSDDAYAYSDKSGQDDAADSEDEFEDESDDIEVAADDSAESYGDEYDDYDSFDNSEARAGKKDLAKEAYKVPEDDELSRFLRESLNEEPLYPQEKGGLSSFSKRGKMKGEEDLMTEHVADYINSEDIASPVDASRNAVAYESTPTSYKERRLAQQWHAEASGGFFRLRSDCNMRAQPSGTKVGVINAGKRLWTSPHNAKWLKVYRKKGVAYISKACI